MDASKTERIKELLAKHLESALDKEKVSDSVLRSAATFLRLYDPQNKPSSKAPPRPPEEDTVKEAAEELGVSPTRVSSIPFESVDQEVEL